MKYLLIQISAEDQEGNHQEVISIIQEPEVDNRIDQLSGPELPIICPILGIPKGYVKIKAIRTQWIEGSE